MLNLSPIRLSWPEGVSLGRFQNCNLLKMDYFRDHGVEDEPKAAIYRRIPTAMIDVPGHGR